MPTCTVDTLINGGACLKTFDLNEQTAILLWFNILELEAIGGTDYRDNLAGLNTAAACYRNLDIITCPPAVPYLVIASNNATAAGASVPATKDAISAAIACLKNYPEGDLIAMQVLVTCQLGQHAAV